MKIGLYCEICNHHEKYNLQYHLKEAHNLTTREYKKQNPGKKVMTGHSKRTLEYWYYRGFSLEESLEKIKEFQKTGKSRFIEKKVQKGMTVDLAQEEWNKKQAKNSIRSVEYYVSRGCSLAEAEEKVSSNQKTYSALSKKFTGKKHTEATKKAISEKVKKAIEAEGVFNRVAKFYQGQVGIRSGGEIKCFLKLKQHLPKLMANVEIGGKIVDMVIGDLAIEYYGDFWHRNPEKYSKDYYARGLLTEAVWKRDQERRERIEEEGYAVFIIWEKDWLRDSNSIILEIKKYIHENSTKDCS